MDLTRLTILSFNKKETKKLLSDIQCMFGGNNVILKLDYDAEKETLEVLAMRVDGDE